MPVPSSISDLSQTANSNSPAGSESPNTADDYLRTLSAFIATLRDGKGFTDPTTLSSAATTDIGAENAMFVQISGTTTITSFGTNYNGPRFIRFTDALTLTHNATSLNLPGGANITTEAGDTCIAIPNATPNGWNVVQYQRADLAPGNADSFAAGAINALATVTFDPAADFVAIADASDSGNSKKALIAVEQIQPISASVGSNALTISATRLSLDFRSTTLGSGTVTRISGTPSNLVISSGSTLGTTSGVQSDIAVLAINNAGTIELAAVNIAGGVDLSETGLISTTAEGGAGAADSATTVYSTTARTNVAYRVIGIIRSTQATAGTWATAPSLIQGIGGLVGPCSASMIRVNTPNGFGSTNTACRRWTTIVESLGTDITYTDSATLGGYFTINTADVYDMSYTDAFSAAADMAITKNATTLTALPAVSEILAESTTASVAQRATVAVSAYLKVGDVIRGQTSGSGSSRSFFTITRRK